MRVWVVLIMSLASVAWSGCRAVPACDDEDCSTPPGDGPFIKWATPRVPLAKDLTIEIVGGRFKGEMLKVELKQGMVTKTLTHMATEESRLVLSFVDAKLGAGEATIKITNSKSKVSEQNAKDVEIVDLARRETARDTTMNAPGWLATGNYKGEDAVFLTDGAEVKYGLLKSPITLNKVGDGLAALAPLDSAMDKVSTGLVIVNNTLKEMTRSLPAATNYETAGAADFLLDKTPTSYIGLAAGLSTATDIVVIVAIDNNKKPKRCTFTITPPKANPCVKIDTPLPNEPKDMWVLDGDVIILGKDGKLTALRGDAMLSSCNPNCFDTQTTAMTFTAVTPGGLDKDRKTDLLAAADKDLYLLLRRNGSGTQFTSSLITPLVPLPSTTKITALALSDLDGDGIPDILLRDQNNQIHAILNEGTHDATRRYSAPVPLLDFNKNPISANRLAATPAGRLVTANGTSLVLYDRN